MNPVKRLALPLLLCVAGAWTATAGSAAAAPGLATGFSDSTTFFGGTPTDNATNLARAKASGASYVRLEISWPGVAPTKPPTAADAKDPAWTGYRWAGADQAVRGVIAAGLTPLVLVNAAPLWAQGGDRPKDLKYPSTSWKPSAAAYRSFAVAVARRYSGRFPDPLAANATLPKVTRWQAWNEPNLSNYLAPQWKRTASGYIPESPAIYRSLLNAFYSGVKSVSAENYVVTAGTAPFGDLHPGEPRMPPAVFWRSLLCVKNRSRPVSTHCRTHVSFDAVAHHPYPIGPPRRHAINADDVVVPDLARITRPVSVAVSAGTVRPKKPKPLWITEISWDSAPDPDGLSLADQAQYMEGAFNVLWRQGARVVIWYLMRDEAPNPSYASTLQSGIFMRGASTASDVSKPSAVAFRFPFTAYRSDGVASLWGRAPRGAGSVTVQARRGTSWVTAAQLRAGSNGIFSGRLRAGRSTQLRAVAGTDTSLVWRVF